MSEDTRLPVPHAPASPIWDSGYRFPEARPALRGIWDDESKARFPWTWRFFNEYYDNDQQSVKKQIAFLKDFILQLDASRQTENTSIEDVQKARLEALIFLSSVYEEVDEFDHSRDIAEQALTWAYDSGDREAIRRCLSHLGELEFGLARFPPTGGHDREGLNRAAIYLQRSIAFLDGRKPSHLFDTIQWLACIWSLQEETFPSSMTMVDWMIALRPGDIGPLQMRYQILRKWNLKEVRAVARRKTFATAAEIAHCCAARLAVNKRDMALELAPLGLEKASEEGNPHLIHLFQNYLAKESGSQIEYTY